jgi:hypothetical protein
MFQAVCTFVRYHIQIHFCFVLFHLLISPSQQNQYLFDIYSIHLVQYYTSKCIIKHRKQFKDPKVKLYNKALPIKQLNEQYEGRSFGMSGVLALPFGV